jgi:putative transposase
MQYSKNLYNAANYLIRQSLFGTGEFLNYNQVQKRLQTSVDYKAIPAKVSQQILMILDIYIISNYICNV